MKKEEKERNNFLSVLNIPMVESGEAISGYSIGVA
jgi:hypothetical protein